jgi:hypothetical protein
MFYSTNEKLNMKRKIINWGRFDIVGEGQWRCNYTDRGYEMARL